MGIKVEVPPDKVRKMILGYYRASLTDKSATGDRAKYVAGRLGISVPNLYRQIAELGIREEIRAMREKAGLSRTGAGAGAKYKCSACGQQGHNARSAECPEWAMANTTTPEQSASPVNNAIVREIAKEALCCLPTVYRALAGLPVRGRVGERVAKVIATKGIRPK